MRYFYSLLITLGTPFILLYLALRGLRDHAYLGRWRERFGFVPDLCKRGGILVHTASVGEFNAASPLIKALLDAYPELPLTVTTQTPTGSRRVHCELGQRVFNSYIPLDLPGAVARFLNRLQPRLIIVIESEIWPNLYLQAKQLKIPLLMANARLSEVSARRFQVAPRFVAKILRSVIWIGAQSMDDAERFSQCGARPQHIEMSGNLKYDLHVANDLEEQGIALRAQWGLHRPVLLAGSTHEADEQVVVPAFVDLLQNLPQALLILVPRHPERFARSAQLARAAGLHTELRSQGEVCSTQAQCFVIDSVGELMRYYACADVAFVGGSMGDEGGHNVLEPAALGKPVLLGPNMDNSRDIVSQLLQYNAAIQVSNRQDLLQAAEKLLGDEVLRKTMGQAGKVLIKKNRAALKTTLAAVRKLL